MTANHKSADPQDLNLTLFIIGIIVLSIMPGVIEFVWQRTRSR